MLSSFWSHGINLSFFFSSRGRHTRFDCDWSSDVCSSDLAEGAELVDTAESLQEGTETILLVEDEAPVRELIRRVLESAGYVVLAAGLPSEAERLLDETAEVDLLLTDI